jgi:hypothetical protein
MKIVIHKDILLKLMEADGETVNFFSKTKLQKVDIFSSK